MKLLVLYVLNKSSIESPEDFVSATFFLIAFDADIFIKHDTTQLCSLRPHKKSFIDEVRYLRHSAEGSQGLPVASNCRSLKPG